MRLGIISDSHHYYDRDGRLYNLSIVKAQFECWAQLFDEVTICAPLYPGDPPVSHSPYDAPNVSLLPIAPAGGNTLRAKADLGFKLAGWWKTLQELLKRVDAVHIRCPNNISILGLAALARSDCFRQAVYTGCWNGQVSPPEPLTYRAQRLFLKHRFRGPVAVYGTWPDQPEHVVPSFSPSYTDGDWEGESAVVARKVDRLRGLSALPDPVKLVTVGSVDYRKNQQLVIRAVRQLADAGVRAELAILGEGGLRSSLESLARELGVEGQIHFNGRTAHRQVRQYYREADFVVQAPRSEGYGKVPNEAFFHGAVPILSDVEISAEIVGHGERGRYFPPDDVDAVVRHVLELARNPGEMIRLIENGRAHARSLTLEVWRDHIRQMLEEHWGVELRDPAARGARGVRSALASPPLE